MYLTAFLHRDTLLEITNRWLSNKLSAEDPLAITRIITYDSFAAWEMLLSFFDALLESLEIEPVYKKKITDKKEFKDFICSGHFDGLERSRMLVSNYRQMSDFYYIGSPLAGYIYHLENGCTAGISRFKRVKRIAEKASRYASLYLETEIQAAAMKLNHSSTDVDTTDETASEDRMMAAEVELMHRFKTNGIALPEHSMTIRDILGIKVIDSGFGESALETAILEMPGAEIVEKERHEGHYNAVHYAVELQADFEYIICRFQETCGSVDYGKRGLPNQTIEADFRNFIATGSKTLQLDIILTTFSELIESEIGRSMHESRIFKQRQDQKFLGNIPMNVEYIIEYLIAVGLSPEIRIEKIPIKIWGRYLPDALSYHVRKLYGMPEYCLLDI